MNNNTTDIFKGFSTEWVERYVSEVGIQIEKNKSEGQVYNKKLDRYYTPTRIPWMIPIWERGVELAKQELLIRKESDGQ
jgi:hypothetical protein